MSSYSPNYPLYPTHDNTILLRVYVSESLYAQQQLNEALTVKEALRDLLKVAAGAGMVAVTGGMGGDTVTDMIFAVESSASILAKINDVISSAGDIAKALKAAMDTNISQGAQAIYDAVDDVVKTIAEKSKISKEIFEEIRDAVEELLNKLIGAVSEWVSTVLPDDAGLGGIIIREALEAAMSKLDDNVYDILKSVFGKLPSQAKEFIGSPEAMTAFMEGIADKIIDYIDGKEADEEEEEEEEKEGGGILGMAGDVVGAVTGGGPLKAVTSPAGGAVKKIVMKPVRNFLDGPFRKMIPQAAETLNKLVTVFFGAVALVQVLARSEWDEEATAEVTPEPEAVAPTSPAEPEATPSQPEQLAAGRSMKINRNQLRLLIGKVVKEATSQPFGTGMKQLKTGDPERDDLVGHT